MPRSSSCCVVDALLAYPPSIHLTIQQSFSNRQDDRIVFIYCAPPYNLCGCHSSVYLLLALLEVILNKFPLDQSHLGIHNVHGTAPRPRVRKIDVFLFILYLVSSARYLCTTSRGHSAEEVGTGSTLQRPTARVHKVILIKCAQMQCIINRLAKIVVIQVN